VCIWSVLLSYINCHLLMAPVLSSLRVSSYLVLICFCLVNNTFMCHFCTSLLPLQMGCHLLYHQSVQLQPSKFELCPYWTVFLSWLHVVSSATDMISRIKIAAARDTLVVQKLRAHLQWQKRGHMKLLFTRHKQIRTRQGDAFKVSRGNSEYRVIFRMQVPPTRTRKRQRWSLHT
jgi:hypothetical protein